MSRSDTLRAELGRLKTKAGTLTKEFAAHRDVAAKASTAARFVESKYIRPDESA